MQPISHKNSIPGSVEPAEQRPIEAPQPEVEHAGEDSSTTGRRVIAPIAQSDKAEAPALMGWRRKLFGERALQLKHGRLALTVENGKVVMLEWQDAEAPHSVA